MLNCLDIARYFIIRAYEGGREALMTNMKVQKLLYYAQSLHLALYDEPLFENEIQAWRYGPVCPPAYHYYSEFEANQLPIPNHSEIASIPEQKQQLLEEVWDYFGIHHAYILSSMTHLEFPWMRARKNLPSDASSTEPILLEDMHLLGEEKLLEIEREHPAYSPIMAHLLEQAFSSKKQSEYVKQGEVHAWLTSLLD
jgi:uncharacterized phage-associated protein